MKIALFSETYVPSKNGVATHVKTLKQGLEKLGHKVLVVTADPSIKKHTIDDGILLCPGKSFKKLYNYGVASPVSSNRLKYLKYFDPDIIHIHTEFGVGLFGLIVAKILKKPLVYTLHTMYDDYIYYIAPKPLNPIVKKTAHKYAKFISKSADAITGPSKKVSEFIKKCGIRKKVTVVPNCVELDSFNINNIDPKKIEELKKLYNISNDETVVCTCARIAKEKNIDVILDNWKEKVKPSDKIKLLIIGDGPHKKSLEKKAKDFKIDNSIIFVGGINRTYLPPYYAICDMFITASITDTNSISMLEAMAMGLPAIHTLDKLNEGQVIPGVNGYIFENSDEMYNSIIDFKNKSDKQKAEFRKSVRLSVEKSGVENLANSILEVYSSTIKRFNKRKTINKYKKYKIYKKYTKHKSIDKTK